MYKNSYDAVVVGAGIGGLVCANYLANAGLSTLVVEQAGIPGGCCTSEKKGGYIFDRGAQLFAGCGKMEPTWSVLQEIEADVLFEKMQSLVLNFPELQLNISQDIDYLRDDLKRYFPAQAEKIDLFFNDLLRIYYRFVNSAGPDPQLEEALKITYAEFLNRYFQSNLLKDALSFLWLIAGDRPDEISALAMINLIGSFLRHGTYRVVGGAQVLADSIAGALIKKGGSIMFSKRVKEVKTDNNKVTGVILDDNSQISACYAVVNADARRFIKDLPQYATGWSPFELNLGVDYPEAEDYEGAYFEENNVNNPLAVFVPTKYDPSLAPAGRQVIHLTTLFPYKYEEVEDWDAVSRELSDKTISRLERIMPGITGKIEISSATAPNAYNGCAYGWASIPSQFYTARPDNKTAVEGLFLTGHWTRPGSGIHSVVRSGKAAAKLILG